MVAIKLPDGSVMDMENGVNGFDVASKISAGLAKAALAVKVNDKLTDLTAPITTDATVTIITAKDKEARCGVPSSGSRRGAPASICGRIPAARRPAKLSSRRPASSGRSRRTNTRQDRARSKSGRARRWNCGATRSRDAHSC